MKAFSSLLLSVGMALVSAPAVPGQTYVQGNVSGTWTKASSPYIVFANVTVPPSAALALEPGVVVKFALGLGMTVKGTLTAVGTPADSIRFTSAEAAPAAGQWGAVVFDSSTALSRLDYVILEYGGRDFSNGVLLADSNALLSHMLVQHNSAGLRLSGNNGLILSSSLVRNNTNYGLIGRYLTVSGVRFVSNSGVYGAIAGSHTTFLQCTFEGNSPIAYILFDGPAASYFRGCVVQGNEAGIGSCYTGDTLWIDSCVVTGNAGHGINANALYNSGVLMVRHNVITGNGGDGITNASQGSIIEFNDIIGNAGGITNIYGDPAMGIRNNVVLNNTGLGLQAAAGTPPPVRFNDVAGNNPNFSGFSMFYGDTSITVNRNGIPADLYGNISRDPLFTDTSAKDYSLQSSSPCIDAGDTLLIDPDGSVSDIGAFPFDHSVGTGNNGLNGPRPFALLRNHPNPLNPLTRISFRLPGPAFVSLAVFDLLGRKAAALIERGLAAGDYSVQWNAGNLPGGVYCCRLQAGGYSETRKLVVRR